MKCTIQETVKAIHHGGGLPKRNGKKRSKTAFSLVCLLSVALLAGCAGTDGGQPVSDGTADGAQGGWSAGDGSSGAADGGGDESNGKGRFMESDIMLPEGVDTAYTVRKLENGNLGVVAGNGSDYCLLQSSDYGESWDMVEITGLPADTYYPHIALAPDGSAAFLPYSEDGAVQAVVVDADGQAEQYTVQLPTVDGENENYIYQAAYDGDGNLIARDLDDSIFVVDFEGGTCSRTFNLQGQGVSYFELAGNRCVAVSDGGAYVFDTASGEEADEWEALADFIGADASLSTLDTDYGTPLVLAEGTDEGGVVYACHDGIYHLASGGSVTEQLVDGSLVSLGDTSLVFCAMAMLDEEHLFVCAQDTAGGKLLGYTYAADASATPQEELVVYALDESVLLRQAAAAFQKDYPDVYVTVQVGMTGDNGVTLEDALSALNTDIMAGNGPDVLILDGMPVEDYIEKGVLADISDVVEEVDREDGIFANIREASEKDGKIYAMPVRFLVPVIEGDAKAVEAGASLETLADYAESLQQAESGVPVLPVKGAKGILYDLYYADSASWIGTDGTLEEDKVENYFLQAKRLYDAGGGADVQQKEYGELYEQYYGDVTFEGERMGSIDIMRGIMEEAQIGFGTLAGVSSFHGLKSAQAVSGASYGVLDGDAGGSYIPYLLAGVTEQGNSGPAKEFVRELLDQEAGSDTNGFPVNQAAYEEQMQKKKEETDLTMGISDEDGNEFSLDYIALTDEEIAEFTEMVESLSTPAMTDRTVKSLVLEQGEKYLEGELGLEEAVAAALQKVNLYLAE